MEMTLPLELILSKKIAVAEAKEIQTWVASGFYPAFAHGAANNYGCAGRVVSPRTEVRR